ncbi:GNAT family N-acetyltransferase [Agromyces sp. G08B096]|uniref:GNAT family N-acetyltransferase n=1 Tax=Agromyces sp. G08B096 TaxID=3156399 RepID=A0AAU7W9C8_9MICO
MPTPNARLVAKTAEDTARWLPVAMAAYERARIAAGDTPEMAARAREASETQFFDDGVVADGHLLFTVEADGEEAGWLWIGPMENPANWYVWDVAIDERFQRRGLGRWTMQEAERIAREHGATALRLNVFAYNTGAIALYESLGFTPGALHLQKTL